jgi:uncharacterized protein (DUF1501 family)
MHNLWKSGNMAVYPSCSYNNSSRSHFKGQDLIEFSNNSVTSPDGWLNRYLQLNPTEAILRAASIGGNLQKTLRGAEIVPSFKFLSQFALTSPGGATNAVRTAANNYFHQVPNSLKPYRDLTHLLGQKLLVDLENIASTYPIPNHIDLGYPNTNFGKQCRDLAHLIKADIGLEVAMVSRGSWDHHNKMGSYATHLEAATYGTAHHNRLAEYSQALEAFYNDLTAAGKIQNVVCFSMTEFGRTVKENANWGTDHGVGGAAFMFGGNVVGGIYGTDGTNGSNATAYPYGLVSGLASNRYLPMTVNYKDCIGDMVTNHGGYDASALGTVIPTHNYTPVTPFTA